MPSLKLSNPFRRSADRPSLKERAAALKATAGRVMKRTKPRTPAEAVAAMAPHHPGTVPYPPKAPTHLLAVNLMIRTEAARLLELADAEFDRLYRGQAEGLDMAQRNRLTEAWECELRMRALAEAASDADPLPASYWHKPPAGFMAHPAIKPGGFLKIAAVLPLEAERLHGIAEAEFERRRKALQGHDHGSDHAERVADLRRTLRLDAWAAVAAEPADAGEAHPDATPANAPAYDLSACTLPQLARFYETWESIWEHLTGAGNAPCFLEKDRNYTPAGVVLDREYARAGDLLSTIAAEASKRTPVEEGDRDERLCVLVRHEMNTNGRPANRALLAELTSAVEA